MPRRIVSLACSNTEILCALGGADLLVGVDDHSDHPPEVVSRLPRVGPDLTPDLDRVAALEPDLVLATLTVPGHERVVAGLEERGLPAIAPEPVSLEDVYRDILEIARRIGTESRGQRLVAELRAEIRPLPPPPSGRPSIAVEWWPKPAILPGKRSWVTDLIHLAGGRNPLGEEDHKSRPVGFEELAAIAPDVIVLSWCGVAFENYRPNVIYENPALRAIPAVTRRRVIPIPEAHLGRPSPRLLDGYRALRAVVEQVTQETTPCLSSSASRMPTSAR